MCVVTDAVLALVEEAGPLLEGAGDVAAAAGAADVAGAFGGADSTSAGLGDAGVQPGAGDLSSSVNASSLGPSTDTAGGAGQTTSALAPGTTSDIPTLTVTGTQSGGGGLSSALDQLSGGIAPIAASGLAAAGAGGGGSGVPGQAGINGPESAPAPSSLSDQGPLLANNDITPGAVTDTGSTLDSGGGFLPATGDSSVQALSPDAMQSLGITPADTTNTALTDTSGAFDPSSVGDPNAVDIQGPSLLDQAGSKAGDIGKWLSSPKNAATAGMLGLSLKNALIPPGLPAADKAAQANAAALTKQALPIIQSGGTATPEWASQKASIDATIDNQIKQQTESIMQAAASSGEGGQNSGIVQQQIAAMTQQANLNRQQLYAQAQAQNVQAALSSLSGGDQTLTSIGSTQLQQSEEAQQLAAQTAEMALLLQTGQKLPGQGGTGIPSSGGGPG